MKGRLPNQQESIQVHVAESGSGDDADNPDQRGTEACVHGRDVFQWKTLENVHVVLGRLHMPTCLRLRLQCEELVQGLGTLAMPSWGSLLCDSLFCLLVLQICFQQVCKN